MEEKEQFINMQECITYEIHTRAVDNLKKFAEIDIEEIETIEDLAFILRFIGRSMAIILLSKVEKKGDETSSMRPAEPADIILRTRIQKNNEGEKDFHSILRNDYGFVEQGSGKFSEAKYDYVFRVPIGDIENSLGSVKPEVFTQAYCWIGGKKIEYSPLLKSDNIGIMRSYAKIIQDGAIDLLLTVEPEVNDKLQSVQQQKKLETLFTSS